MIFSGFTSVQLSNAFQYEITQSDTYSITVSAYQNMLDHLDIHQSGNILYVDLKFKLLVLMTMNNTNITIAMPQLNKLDISGACSGNVAGFNSNDNFEADLSDQPIKPGHSRGENDTGCLRSFRYHRECNIRRYGDYTLGRQQM